MSRIVMCVVAAGLLLVACGKPAASDSNAPADAKALASALTGEDKTSAAANPQCKLFTQAEITKDLGAPVGAGKTAATGTGCQWDAGGEGGFVMVQVVPERYHEPTTGAAGYRRLADVGQEGFVAPYLGGWKAAAIQGPESVNVVVVGGGASEAAAVALLKETMKRKAG
jgi:hypothetical protein